MDCDWAKRDVGEVIRGNSPIMTDTQQLGVLALIINQAAYLELWPVFHGEKKQGKVFLMGVM